MADPTLAERLRRAEKALGENLPFGHPLWKPWALDLADDVVTLAAQLDVANNRIEQLEDWGKVP
jgi:hypothetical protein